MSQREKHVGEKEAPIGNVGEMELFLNTISTQGLKEDQL